jgi:hypothetical protein
MAVQLGRGPHHQCPVPALYVLPMTLQYQQTPTDK